MSLCYLSSLKKVIRDSYLLLLVKIREDRKAAFASEFRASDNDGCAGRNGYV